MAKAPGSGIEITKLVYTGNRIKELRDRQGLKLLGVATRSGGLFTERSIWRWEHGDVPSVQLGVALCLILKHPIDLLAGSTTKHLFQFDIETRDALVAQTSP